ncbi:unnamed protein product [Oppiella nova]|uniref:uS12 prolyl 3-hydroxylase n=1 Tax=Oppiella nova TaxID=334625 RepID=A0A7R9QNA3_9ACAR|nr:unnamed protein product [Oppiella nova]CAG2168977.1 unnamed protein product [Oppiella nova]
MSDDKPKTTHPSNGCVSGDHKRQKIGANDIDVSINSGYRKSLDQLADWYSSGVKPTGDELNTEDIRVIDKPFKVISFDEFIDSHEFLKRLKQDINQLDLNVKNNDLYRLRQSVDLNNIKSGTIGQLCELMAKQVKPFVERLTNLSLNDNIALTVSRYEQNDYLLCHDDDVMSEDQMDGRRVAFILYLVPDWKTSDGGLLDLYDSNENGEPSEIVASVAPKWNRFAFFEVNPITWHQVSEVVSDSKTRLSVHGWFHGVPLERPNRYVEPQISTDAATEVPLEVVKSWINPIYLQDSTQCEIQSRFEDLSEIVLQDFFNGDKYQELARALSDSEAIVWKYNKPPNMRRYETAVVSSCPAIVLEAYELFRSDAMFLILSNLTGLKLHELAVNNGSDDDEDDSDDSSEGNPRCRGEIRRWSHSCYTLIHDNSAELSEKAALDVVIHFNCDNEFDRENGGFISYIARGEDEELLTIDPFSNNLNIVFRDTKTARFVKYINNKCVDTVGRDWKGIGKGLERR